MSEPAPPPAAASFEDATPVTSTMSAVRAQAREIAQLNVQVVHVGVLVQAIAKTHLLVMRMLAIVVGGQLALIALALWLALKAK
jgi:hypothetical protein